jgi:hypothetical protein
MPIETTGTNQNSYITMAEANAILLTVHASFMDIGVQLDANKDEPYLIEAARDLSQLFAWTGKPATVEQNLAWPRKGVVRPGYVQVGEPQWSVAGTDEDFLVYKILYLSGSSNAPTIPDDVVPLEIREAQALIAVLRKNGSNLISDTQGDAQGLQLPGGLKIAYVNAIREAADIHKRTAQFGAFVGQSIVGA